MLYYTPVVGSAYTLAVLVARQHGCVGSNTRDHGHTRSFRRDLGRLAPPSENPWSWTIFCLILFKLHEICKLNARKIIKTVATVGPYVIF